MNCCPICAQALSTVDIGGRARSACIACEFVNWDNPKPVTATVVSMDGGIVLVKRKFEPFVDDWCLPGGFIESTEHPADSAAREVFEETGLEIKVTRLIDASSPGRGINVVILFYLGSPTGGQLMAGDDASEVKVFQRDELPANIAFELHRQIIKRFFDTNGAFHADQMLQRPL